MKIYVTTCYEETWDGKNEDSVEVLTGHAYLTIEEAQEAANHLWGGNVEEVELHERQNGN